MELKEWMEKNQDVVEGWIMFFLKEEYKGSSDKQIFGFDQM